MESVSPPPVPAGDARSFATEHTRTLFGHPVALTVLFLAAMWEIFALVGMRAALVYYLVDQLRFTEQAAVQVYGYSTAAAFLTAPVGGIIADRLLGAWRTALLGAVLLGTGLFLLSAESFLYPGLAVIAIGSGLFKPTMLAQVGHLYSIDDPRRDRAYNIYSVGCNTGATVAPLVCGALGVAYGWHWAFVATGIGMIVSVAILIGGRSFLPRPAVAHTPRVGAPAVAAPGAGSPGAGMSMVLAIAWLGGVLFFTAHGQIGGTIALWAESDVDRVVRLNGSLFTIPAAWFQSLNPFLIFVLVPLVNRIWARDSVASTGRDLRRMALGGVLLAASFAVFAAAALGSGPRHGASSLWVVLALVPYTLGEIYLNTIGQALFSRLAWRGMVSVAMGIWILTLMLGTAASGWLGRVWRVLSPAEFFTLTATVALASTAILAAARGVLHRRLPTAG